MTERIRFLAESALRKNAEAPWAGISEYDLLAGGRNGGAPSPSEFEDLSGPDIPDAKEKYKDLVDRLWIPAGNHMSANFEYVLRYGLKGCLRRIADALEMHCNDEVRTLYLHELGKVCVSIMDWSESLAGLCREKAEKEVNPVRKAELDALSMACANVPGNPAGSFYEAVQSFYLIFLLFPDGVGRLDQYLYPYYSADLESGKITPAFAFELIETLLVKIFEYLGSSQLWSGNNHMVVSGCKPDGMDGHNALTSMLLKAVEELPIWRPQLSFRWTARTTFAELREALCSNIGRHDLIMFLNDEVILAGLDRLAVPREDAVNYSMSGCNELILTGQSQMGSAEGHFNLLRALEKTLDQFFAHAGETSSVKTFDDFYDAYCRMLKRDIDIIIEISESRDLLAMRHSMLLPSLLTDGCIESGLSITKGGAKYNFCTWCAAGLINLADSLSVIRQFVFEEKSIGLSDFTAMLHSDWKGYEDVRADILKRGHFFGNDDDEADCLVNRVIDTLCEFVEEKAPVRGGKYTFGTLAGYELAHIAFGRNTGATPDGRHAGDEFAATIAAGPGKDRNGVTAFLKSASKIEYVKIPSAVTVGVHLERSMTDSDHKIDLLTSLLQTYFKLGGVHLQINYISADELAKAQENPQAYRNLRVRVTGFSGFFTLFEKDLQDEIISRTAHRK